MAPGVLPLQRVHLRVSLILCFIVPVPPLKNLRVSAQGFQTKDYGLAAVRLLFSTAAVRMLFSTAAVRMLFSGFPKRD